MHFVVVPGTVSFEHRIAPGRSVDPPLGLLATPWNPAFSHDSSLWAHYRLFLAESGRQIPALCLTSSLIIYRYFTDSAAITTSIEDSLLLSDRIQ